MTYYNNKFKELKKLIIVILSFLNSRSLWETWLNSYAWLSYYLFEIILFDLEVIISY